MEIPFNLAATKELLEKSTCYYIICVDNTGTYSYVNERYAKTFNFITQDFIGKPFHITMHPEDAKVCEQAGKRCYEHPGQLFPAIIRKHDGEGGYIVTQWEFTLIEQDGVPLGVFCLGFDITEYMRVKSDYSTINRVLANKNELLDAIAFEQSHIVRAPLANIMGLVSVLKGFDLGDSASIIVKMLEQSSNQLDAAVRNIVKKANG